MHRRVVLLGWVLFTACGDAQLRPHVAAPPPTPAAPRSAALPSPSSLAPTQIAPFAASRPGASPQLERHFAELTAAAKYPGLVVGLVVDSDMVWWKGYGVRDIDSKRPVDADTLFRVASLTK